MVKRLLNLIRAARIESKESKLNFTNNKNLTKIKRIKRLHLTFPKSWNFIPTYIYCQYNLFVYVLRVLIISTLINFSLQRLIKEHEEIN